MRTNLDAKAKYINSTFSESDPIFSKICEALRHDGLDGIQVGPNEGRLLNTLVRLGGYSNVLEIGTLYGYSTLWLAQAVPEDGQVVTVDVSGPNQSKAQELLSTSPHAHKVKFVCGDGREVLPSLKSEGPWDLVFIDANKAAYLDYLDWAEANVRQGGMIVGDNTFLFDAMFGPCRDPNVGEKQIQVMRAFNARLADPQRYASGILPTQEGMTIALKLF